MTVARRQLVDVELTRYYHCISRCVRRAHLCGEGREHRKQWIEDRLEFLADRFAISVCGFAVMDNHLHVLVRLDPATAEGWTAEEVARRWLEVYPPRESRGNDPSDTRSAVDRLLGDPQRVETLRRRLVSLGWFMKSLKEPLSRRANREDDCKGTFWESRYKSIAIMDEEALLATCAYIDLNPVAAGVAALPESSPHTSVRQRIQHARRSGRLSALKAAKRGSIFGSRSAGRLEEVHWLCPLEDLRYKGSVREGMIEGFSLGSYLQLIDYTSRLARSGKAHLSAEVVEIFDRLRISPTYWADRMKQIFAKPRLLGSYFSTCRDRLQAVAQRRGVHHVANMVPLKKLG